MALGGLMVWKGTQGRTLEGLKFDISSDQVRAWGCVDALVPLVPL
jgi:hypothetical protein